MARQPVGLALAAAVEEATSSGYVVRLAKQGKRAADPTRVGRRWVRF
jgi:hypothetical protein